MFLRTHPIDYALIYIYVRESSQQATYSFHTRCISHTALPSPIYVHVNLFTSNEIPPPRDDVARTFYSSAVSSRSIRRVRSYAYVYIYVRVCVRQPGGMTNYVETRAGAPGRASGRAPRGPRVFNGSRKFGPPGLADVSHTMRRTKDGLRGARSPPRSQEASSNTHRPLSLFLPRSRSRIPTRPSRG